MRTLFAIMSLLGSSLIFAATTITTTGTPDEQALTAEAKGLVMAFAGRLKPQLQQALGEGGPTLAIEVCASQAPRIADALAAGSGWSVSRVSLGARNATRAEPDNWERAVLKEFDQRAADGEHPPALYRGEIRNGQFRYMQAQGVEGVCLLCHGENLGDDVRAVLKDYYPDDRATGYRLGQVRGAISLSKEL